MLLESEPRAILAIQKEQMEEALKGVQQTLWDARLKEFLSPLWRDGIRRQWCQRDILVSPARKQKERRGIFECHWHRGQAVVSLVKKNASNHTAAGPCERMISPTETSQAKVWVVGSEDESMM